MSDGKKYSKRPKTRSPVDRRPEKPDLEKGPVQLGSLDLNESLIFHQNSSGQMKTRI